MLANPLVRYGGENRAPSPSPPPSPSCTAPISQLWLPIYRYSERCAINQKRVWLVNWKKRPNDAIAPRTDRPLGSTTTRKTIALRVDHSAGLRGITTARAPFTRGMFSTAEHPSANLGLATPTSPRGFTPGPRHHSAFSGWRGGAPKPASPPQGTKAHNDDAAPPGPPNCAVRWVVSFPCRQRPAPPKPPNCTRWVRTEPNRVLERSPQTPISHPAQRAFGV